MTSPYRKKLIEVSLPLAAINAESAREKSIRHGHPSTLHLWWARRPLAACRAVLFASLVDDPDSDPQYRKADGAVDEDRAGIKRADLFNLIEELVAWENSNNADVIRSARAEIARCVASRQLELKELDPKLELAPKVTVRDLVTRGHCRPKSMGLDKKSGRVRFAFDVSHLPPAEVVNRFLAEHAPPVLDPFAGGGSIPLEAQRLGLRAYASDLNPVPVLINKALIEFPPLFAGRPPVNPDSRPDSSSNVKRKKVLLERDWSAAAGLADDVRYYGNWMQIEAEKRIGHLYPKVEVTKEIVKTRPDLKDYIGQRLTVIAWLWSRTIKCGNPACGATTPLLRSYWLSSKAGRRAWLVPNIDLEARSVTFSISTEGDGPEEAAKTARGANFRCLVCNQPANEAYIKEQGLSGKLGLQLTATVVEAGRTRLYLAARDCDVTLADSATPTWSPTTDLSTHPQYMGVVYYGLKQNASLFTKRQLHLLSTLADILDELKTYLPNQIEQAGTHGPDANRYAQAIITYLGIAVSKLAAFHCTMGIWRAADNKSGRAFGRHALPMVWDFPEVNPFADAGGELLGTFESMAGLIADLTPSPIGMVSQLDATSRLMHDSCCICTDPPYYDNVPYADLSDFYYVWLRRLLASVYPNEMSTVLVPKHQELVADHFRHGGRDKAQAFFEDGLSRCFSQMVNAQQPDYPLTVFYAFRQAEEVEQDASEEQFSSTGWETMLAGIISAGFSITGTWPFRTEQLKALKGERNALASSIVLVCRPRPANAAIATRKEFLIELRRDLPEALRNLQHGNIAPVDLAQSAIGPGMAVFTRYGKVMESDGSPMTVRTSLGIINQVLDEVLAEQEGEFDNDTRWALAWFDQFGMKEGSFGDAETLSKAKNTSVNGLVEAGVTFAKSGKVRLLKRDELAEDWDPATDRRLTVWESVQHLIRVLETQGEEAAGDLVKKLGSQAETCRDLAYRLYSVCERKKWAEEALAYNGLVIAWPELVRLSLASDTRPRDTQAQLFS